MGKRRGQQQQNGNRSQKRLRPGSKKEDDFDHVSSDDYVVVDDLMFVKPYVFEFKAHFKPRWAGKKVFDVFRDEFRHAAKGYWEREFRDGRVLTNNSPISTGTFWNDGMEVQHIVHRHESAVLSAKIHIAYDENGYMVVSKPPSIPIHPCGTYRRNCLLFILKALYGAGKLLAVHRLDKETSGLVILAKDTEHASKFCEEIKQHKVQKTYLAEVQGHFLQGSIVCNERILWDKRLQRASISSEGLEAETSFRILLYKKQRNTSIVECKPKTGRTHQIRIHLTHLGYPIVNDPYYGKSSDTVYDCVNVKQRMAVNITLEHEKFHESECARNLRWKNSVSTWIKEFYKQKGHCLTITEEGEHLDCTNCPQVVNVKNVEVKDMYIHLHALKYESSKWSFEVPRPEWANNTQINHAASNNKRPFRLSCTIV